MRLILLGAPGSGKGTQGQALAELFDVRHVSTGDLLRDHIARGTELGLAARPYTQRGELVPDDLMLQVAGSAVAEAAREGGYVLDGFPRTLAQAERAYELAGPADLLADAVVYLAVPDDVVRERLAARAVDGRVDDADPEVVERRLRVFHEETEPLLDFYRNRGILVTVDASLPPNDVTAAMLEAVKPLPRVTQYRSGVERRGLLTVDDLRAAVVSGDIDTVLVGFADMHGRLQGKRFHGRFFVDEVLEHGTEACNYLLAVDVDMTPASGYAMSSWDAGYGDFVLEPDLSTLRSIPWHPGTAMVMADVRWDDGSAVVASPRQILRAQLDRLAALGWHAMVGTELELIIFQDSYEDAWRSGYRDLTPANQYNADYSLVATGRVEPLLRRIRNSMADAGMVVESAKGECNLGQHEIAFRYDDALTTCDNHSIYKAGAKEIAAQEGMALTFMAKFNEREGNSCHIHFSLRDEADAPVMAGDRDHGFSPVMEHFLAGQLACQRELTLLFAPNVNSFKRYQPESFAPTAIAWGLDNRTCALRVVGHGPSLRFEHRVPGGDVNPYLAVAGLIAAGLHGVDQSLALEAPCTSNAYERKGARIPSTLREAAELWASSAVARGAFGDEVVDHYANMARVELAAFDAAVTDWERYRGFERL